MRKYEYKTVMIEVPRNRGVFSSKVSSEATEKMEVILNELGAHGWRLSGVFPITNGANPSQIDAAAHHFMRELPVVS